MKHLLLFLVVICPLALAAQTKKLNIKKNEVVYIEKITPIMTSDFKRGFRVLIHNASNQTIVGVKFTLDFNDSNNTNDFSENSGCLKEFKAKVNIQKNTSKSYSVTNVNTGAGCISMPNGIVNTIIFSDRTFQVLRPTASDIIGIGK